MCFSRPHDQSASCPDQQEPPEEAQLIIKPGNALQVGLIDTNIVNPPVPPWQDMLAGVSLRVFVHEAEDDPPADLCFDYRLTTTEPDTVLPLIHFEMPEAEQHRLVAQLAEIDAQLISLLVHAPCVSGSDLLLAWSDPIPVRPPNGEPYEVRLTTSHFSVHPKRDSDALSHITWVAEACTFEPLKRWYT